MIPPPFLVGCLLIVSTISVGIVTELSSRHSCAPHHCCGPWYDGCETLTQKSLALDVPSSVFFPHSHHLGSKPRFEPGNVASSFIFYKIRTWRLVYLNLPANHLHSLHIWCSPYHLQCSPLHVAADTSNSTSDGPKHSWCGGTVELQICMLASCHGLPNCRC